MALDSHARQEALHRQFAQECDPVTDAQLAASAIYWALALDGPIRVAADRIMRMFTVAIVPRVQHQTSDDRLLAYAAELKALTLARHAAYWVFLAQMFKMDDALDEEMLSYVAEFSFSLEGRLRQISAGRLKPSRSDDPALKPWAEALSLHGSFWLVGRDRGVPVADLMQTYWHSRPIGVHGEMRSPEIYAVVSTDEVTGRSFPVRGDDGNPFQGTLDEARAFVRKYMADMSDEPSTDAVFAVRVGTTEKIELARGQRA
jgi:hypothetical protein